MSILKLDFGEFEARITALNAVVEKFADKRSTFAGLPDSVWSQIQELGKVSPTEVAALAVIDGVFEEIDGRFQALVVQLRIALEIFQETDQLQAGDYERLSGMITTISTRAAYDQPDWMAEVLPRIFGAIADFETDIATTGGGVVTPNANPGGATANGSSAGTTHG